MFGGDAAQCRPEVLVSSFRLAVSLWVVAGGEAGRGP